MKIAIRYYTQTGNTKKLAQAIAEALGVEAKDITCPLEEKTDILFLCNSVYWAGIDRRVKAFVKANSDKIGTLVNVSTAAMIESTYKQMQSVAADAGVSPLCRQSTC
ncbi:MAG: flavodoxin family protein [Ruminococcus sp.]|nr:flavodoxin family protein [Ruminococcus sp.]